MSGYWAVEIDGAGAEEMIEVEVKWRQSGRHADVVN
jgi:hypothetical protein